MKKRPNNFRDWLEWKYKQFIRMRNKSNINKTEFVVDCFYDGISFTVYKDDGKGAKCVYHDNIYTKEFPLLFQLEDFVAVGFARYCKEEIPHAYIKARHANKLMYPKLFYDSGNLYKFVEQDNVCSTFLDVEKQTFVHLNHNKLIIIKDFYQ